MREEQTKNDVNKLLVNWLPGPQSISGGEIFGSQVQHLGATLDCRYAFVAQFVGSKNCMRTLIGQRLDFWKTLDMYYASMKANQ